MTADEPQLTPRRVFAFVVMVFGMFMAILDIQIVSASLSEIQAGLAASPDEISWVQTSYLIAEVVMIPLSGFLARMMSTRYLFVLSAAGFTASSFLCATSGSIEEMILWRALQGFLGGGMIPSVFAAAFTIFPASKRSVVSPVIGLIATLAPTVGPTVGGYLSYTLSWHWLFLVNVLPGIGVTLGAFLLIDFDRPDWRLFDRFDWWGLLALAAFLGGLEYVLEEGPGNDWLADETVAAFVVVTVLGAIVSFWRAFTRDEPIVDLSAFGNVNFALGSAFSFVMGIGLYGLTYLYPLYLASIRGYDSLMIGETVFVSGLAMFVSAPIAGFLSARIDLRLMLLAGFAGFAVSTWMLTGMTAEWDFNELLVPQILRGVSLMLSMVPINNLALGTLPRDKMKGGSGLFNLTRNLGGAVGLAVINTQLSDRGDLHYERLREAVSWTNDAAMRELSVMAANLSARGLDGQTGALVQMAARLRQQATVMSFIDVFLMLALLFGGLAASAFFMRAPDPGGGGGAGH
ncbi:MFS transporter [Rhodovulum sulfidophilum]|uniref:Bcr/CflA subfamily drug resistance transporter n=1 Tax=Rhodovulum sulfidophilum TaxID=35806 RepID=A0A0D6B4F9_RHOSU|nr:DHA2 family efflux MFS transporter permease subunit [Rhodovulum sulfidophilum]MBK5924399.1 MFS transporter [Rhodovulum sulfidophilum]MBL3562771.1 DHA2 family efflux MFS transporter permease subunit [Rhodovulum sulfidophilum]MBL3573408.1 DHA2 family efflux MFS transporter permease subunit [Rhodovulum sulfidophilum]MCE8418186.1 DHA2 family efflux MFS transporter permease subunit [Rhodovulum sulfidophilum]MCE8430957.1 DHA2 family efflux MFS transporter permease subunit [Rhodovulum sulfidophilu